MSRTPPAAPEMCHHDGYSHSKLVPCPRERTAAPELPEGWHMWETPGRVWFRWNGETATSLDELRALLATQGLRIVDAKDRAVLEAMSKAPGESLQQNVDDAEITPDWYLALAKAELARREKA